MRPVELSKLVLRLNTLCHRQLENAAGMAVSRTHYDVEAEHWLLFLLQAENSDISCIIKALGLNAASLGARLEKILAELKTGNGRAPSLSPDIVRLIKSAWLSASVEKNAQSLRSADILMALAADTDGCFSLRNALTPLLNALVRHTSEEILSLCDGSIEVPSATAASADSEGDDTEVVRDKRFGAALTRYAQDLVAQAELGKTDPVLGRDSEIRQMADILLRRRQNNPILVGEAGVGKTAIVEGLAQRLADGDVPPALRNTRIFTLDLGLLQAGAGVKGEFENRLKEVIADVDAAPVPVILFIDEAHTLIGAGAAGAGSGDAANLLKPALARGTLRVIAATTWAEYKKYFEKDAALTRRFQPVSVDEPAISIATAMLRGLTRTLSKHHDVLILEEAVHAAVSLSARYIPGRQLPDKAVSLLDTACARVAMSQNATPALLEDAERQLTMLKTEISALECEDIFGHEKEKERLTTLQAELVSEENRRTALADKAAQEHALVTELSALRTRLADVGSEEEKTTLNAAYRDAVARLEALQGEHPMIFPMVDHNAIAAVVSDWTGIPMGRMKSSQLQSVLTLEQTMKKRIIGQDHALHAIAQAVQTSRAGLNDPRKPVGVFLMAGTSGVGKTETALALADLLYGGEQSLTVINMSEFKEEHKVSLLMGSPPGYIGYGEGGILTEAVRRKPYSVLLLDEMEKAHPGVQDIFFQVFDKGHMKDGEGRDIDFRNTLIVMTSNAGTELLTSLYADPETAPPQETVNKLVYEELQKSFKPAFLGRTKVIPYIPLSRDTLLSIIDLQLARVRERVRERFGIDLGISESIKNMLISHCEEGSAGARALEKIISDTLLPTISGYILEQLLEPDHAKKIKNMKLFIDLNADSIPFMTEY